MKKFIVILALAFALIGFVFWGCTDEIPEVPVVDNTPFDIDYYLPIIKEVAYMIDYDDVVSPTAKNYYKGDNEFQGVCTHYALLFSIKTGAEFISNNNIGIPSGRWKFIGEDKTFDESKIYGRTQISPSGAYNYWMSEDIDDMGMYHPNIGAYRLRWIDHYSTSITVDHAWNLIKGVEVDCTWMDTQNNWQH